MKRHLSSMTILLALPQGELRSQLHLLLSTASDIASVLPVENAQGVLTSLQTGTVDFIILDESLLADEPPSLIDEVLEIKTLPILILASRREARRARSACAQGALDILTYADIACSAERTLSVVRMLATIQIPPPKRTHTGIPFKKPETSQVIGIVSSSGGPQVLRDLFKQLPPRYPYPILVAQHNAKGFSEGLVQWLSQNSAVPAVRAEMGMRLTPERIFVAPSGMNMMVDGGKLVLAPPVVGQHYTPSGDHLLTSLSREFGDMVIGIILSGMGDDGTQGVKAVKNAGGCTIAQDEATSQIFGMPKEAIASGAIDHILSPTQIAQKLKQLSDKCETRKTGMFSR